MHNRFFLITGTSRGIGEALAKKVLREGHTVLGVARKRSDALISANYFHLSYDLADTTHVDQIMLKLDEILDKHSFDFVCLVNNASSSEPGGVIEKCAAYDIDSHVKIGLIAPMILTSMFIQKFKDDQIGKKVVFISSGAAFDAYAEDSIYCATKAGLHMFAQCVGLEQKNRQHGFELISIGPGMVDTYMQQVARSKTAAEYSMAVYLKKAYEDGLLAKPDDVAEKIFTILGITYEQGNYVGVS